MLFLIAGCTANSVRFQVVDGDTQQPLKDVRVQQNSESLDMLFPGSFTVSYPATGADGIIQTPRLNNDYGHGFSFKANGYMQSMANIHAYNFGDDYEVWAPLDEYSLPARQSVYESRGKIGELTGPLKIPMYRIGNPSARPMDSLPAATK
jgi:hypothetical protein